MLMIEFKALYRAARRIIVKEKLTCNGTRIVDMMKYGISNINFGSNEYTGSIKKKTRETINYC